MSWVPSQPGLQIKCQNIQEYRETLFQQIILLLINWLIKTHRVSCIPVWPPTHHVAEGNPETRDPSARITGVQHHTWQLQDLWWLLVVLIVTHPRPHPRVQVWCHLCLTLQCSSAASCFEWQLTGFSYWIFSVFLSKPVSPSRWPSLKTLAFSCSVYLKSQRHCMGTWSVMLSRCSSCCLRESSQTSMGCV